MQTFTITLGGNYVGRRTGIHAKTVSAAVKRFLDGKIARMGWTMGDTDHMRMDTGETLTITVIRTE